MDFEEMTAPIGEAGQRDPREFPFGVYMHDVHPNPTLGRFQWYASVSDLLDAICTNMPAIYGDPADDESGYSEMVADLKSERAAAGDCEALTDVLRARIAKHFEGNSEVLWWGTFEHLCSTMAPWPRELRREFREDGEFDDGTPMDAPIADSELDDWVDMLSNYGY